MPVQNVIDTPQGYKAFNANNKAEIFKSYGSVIKEFEGIKTTATPTDIIQDVNVRVPFTRFDYEFFRPNEALPRNFRQAVYACRGVYLHLGIIRNVIDMMTDFACEDLKLLHHDKKIEAFYKVWAKKVKLQEIATEFVRHLLIDGNVVAKRVTAKITKPIEKQWLSKADVDIKVIKEEDTLQDREIPWRYIFLNVAALQVYGNLAERMGGHVQLGYHITNDLIAAVMTNDPKKKDITDQLPKDIKDQITKGTSYIQLDMSKIHIAYNKKDQWDLWAHPPLMSIMKDVQYKEKLRQMELCAADGFINVIRIWKLGDHKEGILPDAQAIQKLVNMLNANTGGGALDIVWDTMIDMKDYYPPIDKILGQEKYKEVDKDILIGLGVPEVLIGGSGGKFSNSWVQLKTLMEKLKAIRLKLREFLHGEIEIVAKAMGFDALPVIHFNDMNLQDESIKQKLIISLLDRNIISVEAVLNTFGEEFLFEIERIQTEEKLLKAKGIERINPLDPPEDSQNKDIPPVKPDGGKGRPPLSKDSSTRDQRKAKVRTKADILFGLEAVDAIDEHIIPIYMESFGVSNARKLTNEQKLKINNVRSYVLACIKPKDDLSKDGLISISSDFSRFNNTVIIAIEKALSDYLVENGSVPTLAERKNIEALCWSDVNITEKEDNNATI